MTAGGGGETGDLMTACGEAFLGGGLRYINLKRSSSYMSGSCLSGTVCKIPFFYFIYFSFICNWLCVGLEISLYSLS